ncbi:hypothetical protein R4Z10_06435 [Niallia sp. XMNu-256]|uniref:hypothetical protein n=1 Tax=Niallia sp. XMNu-256 TaxID=3082444 RepID=UPI0030CA9FBC
MNRKSTINQFQLSQITVNTIDTASGIFIGTNYAQNWSSKRKNNYGFGSVSQSKVSNNISYVIDEDWVDTPIENKPSILYDGDRAGNANEIEIGEINVNVLDTGAAVSVGENDLNAWSAHSKRNAGQGRFAGEIQNTQNSSLILDSDVMDAQMNDYKGLL